MIEWLYKEDVCAMLGISMPTLNRLIAKKKIAYYKSGEHKSARVQFDRKDVIKYIHSRKVK